MKADRFHDGMEITFRWNERLLPVKFLYDHRDAEGTRDVTDDPERRRGSFALHHATHVLGILLQKPKLWAVSSRPLHRVHAADYICSA